MHIHSLDKQATLVREYRAEELPYILRVFATSKHVLTKLHYTVHTDHE